MIPVEHGKPHLGLIPLFRLYRCKTNDHMFIGPNAFGLWTAILWPRRDGSGIHELLLGPPGRANDKPWTWARLLTTLDYVANCKTGEDMLLGHIGMTTIVAALDRSTPQDTKKESRPTMLVSAAIVPPRWSWAFGDELND